MTSNVQNVRFFADTAAEDEEGDRRDDFNPLDLSRESFASDMLSNRRFIESRLLPSSSGAKPETDEKMKKKVVLVPPRKWHRGYLDQEDVAFRKSHFKYDRPDPNAGHRPELVLGAFRDLPLATVARPTVDNGDADEAMDVSFAGSDTTFINSVGRIWGRPAALEPPPLLLLPVASGLLPAKSAERFNAAMQRLDESPTSVRLVDELLGELSAIKTATCDSFMSQIHSKRTTWSAISGMLESTFTCFDSCEARLRRAREEAVRADEERSRNKWEEVVKLVGDAHGFGEEQRKAIGLEELVEEATETMEKLSGEILAALRKAEEEQEAKEERRLDIVEERCDWDTPE